MAYNDLYQDLQNVDASRQSRSLYSKKILTNQSLVSSLIDILFLVDDPTSFKAAWILEFVIIEDINLIVPHLDKFCAGIKALRFDSAIRPTSKICSLIALQYASKGTNAVKRNFKVIHKEQLIESCFDWLITDQKVAAKVHAMETLFLLGDKEEWVYAELITILNRDYEKESAGFKSRARRILKKLRH